MATKSAGSRGGQYSFSSSYGNISLARGVRHVDNTDDRLLHIRGRFVAMEGVEFAYSQKGGRVIHARQSLLGSIGCCV